MKKILKRDLMKFTGKILKTMVDREQEKWPPHCVGILHQPKRPININYTK